MLLTLFIQRISYQKPSFNVGTHEVWLQCLKRHMAEEKIKVPSSLSNATQLQQCLQENACFQM